MLSRPLRSVSGTAKKPGSTLVATGVTPSPLMVPASSDHAANAMTGQYHWTLRKVVFILSQRMARKLLHWLFLSFLYKRPGACCCIKQINHVQPRTKSSSCRLQKPGRSFWHIYLPLAFTCAVPYWLAKINPFDVIGHRFTITITGGLSIVYFRKYPLTWQAALMPGEIIPGRGFLPGKFLFTDIIRVCKTYISEATVTAAYSMNYPDPGMNELRIYYA